MGSFPPYFKGPIIFPIIGKIVGPIVGGVFSNIIDLIKACNPLLASDSRVITAQDGRPVLQGQHILFNGTTQSITAPHLVGTETVVSSFGTSVPTVAAGTISFTAGTCAILLLSDGTLYEMQEHGGDAVQDSSGADNHGTLTNNPLRVDDNTLGPVDPANERGFSTRMLFDGVAGVSLDSLYILEDGEFISLSFEVSLTGALQHILGKTPSFTSSGLRVSFGGNMSFASVSSTEEYLTLIPVIGLNKIVISRSGLNITLTLNGLGEVKSFADPAAEIGHIGRSAGSSLVGVIYDVNFNEDHFYEGTGPTDADWLDTIGSNNGTVTGGEQYIDLVRADDANKTILGDVPAWPGSGYAHDWVDTQSNGRSFNGTTQHVTFASLTGSETVVSSFGTSTPSIAAGQINFTAGTCAGLVLSNGLIIPMADELTTCYSTTAGVSGTYVNAPPVILQDDYHFNINFGFSDTGGDRVPADKDDNGLDVDGATLTFPTIDSGHNTAETIFDFRTADDDEKTPAINLASPALPDTYTFGDVQTSNFRFRILPDGKGVDRLLAFGSDPNEECLTAIGRYHDEVGSHLWFDADAWDDGDAWID